MSTQTLPDQEGTVQKLSESDVFNLLSDARRRYILDSLRTWGEMTVSELATHVSSHTGEDTETLHTSFHHCHLPKLEDYGVIERTGGKVRLGPRSPELRRHRLADKR